jgi:SAM-dependent methyltransferase
MTHNPLPAPLVSVALPLAPNVSPELLETCRAALARQTYRNFEVLLLVSEGAAAEVWGLAHRCPAARVFRGSFTKSGARNFLAAQATGRYMLLLDVDMELDPAVLSECVAVAETRGSEAVIAPVHEAPRATFWARCRALEKELILGDEGAECPLFIALSLFWRMGGFDESLDLLDDGSLTANLMTQGVVFDRVSAPIFTRETNRLSEMFRRKYRRGRFIPAFLQKFPEAPQVRYATRFAKAYLPHWKLLVKFPFLTVGLAFLKVLDMAALILGRLRPIALPEGNSAQAYFRPEVAGTYDPLRLNDNFNRYKHYAETRALLSLLPRSPSCLVEVGCGTGRVTAAFAAQGYSIVPCDPSPAMLDQFTRKLIGSPGCLPPPIQSDGTALPFVAGCFESAYALRVIWHLPTACQREQLLAEMARVTSHCIILDITQAQRWRHPFTRWPAAVYFAFRPRERAAHQSRHFFTLDEFTELAAAVGVRLEHSIPLDVLSPVWLRLLPAGLARFLHPTLYRLETRLSRVMPPGRFLVKLVKGL